MLPGDRKSIEPMAARVQPGNERSAHQSMHYLVAEAAWSGEAMLHAAAKRVLPKLTATAEPVRWTIDDTGFPNKAKPSVGVAHQYCGQTGKRDNRRVAVSLSRSALRVAVLR
jgi:SRSO17 transposase